MENQDLFERCHIIAYSLSARIADKKNIFIGTNALNKSIMKKILMLGGAMQQIPAIKCAKELGYYVITCDYLPENEGHKYADK